MLYYHYILFLFELNLSPFIPLSLKGKGEGLEEGASPLQTTLNRLSYGYGLNLAQMWGVEGEDSIRLPQLGFLNNDGFSLIVTRFWHF